MSSVDLPPIVIIHGLKGSFLKDKRTNVRKYLTLGTLLNLVDDQFPLPLERENDNKGQQKMDDIVSDGVMDRIGYRCLSLAEIYATLIDHLKAKGREVHEFHYDWRRELEETSNNLEIYLDNLLKDSKYGAQMICHSMGGLITFPLINIRPDLFHSILFGGAALGPGLNFLQDVSIPGLLLIYYL